MFISATDRVRAEIESRIVSGVLAPGAALDEARLSEMFSVSRTPVREALLQLATLGFIRIVPRSGIYVVRLSPRDLASMYEVLAQSEGLCARLVINRINDEQLSMLRQLHADGKTYAEKGEIEAFIDYNKAFHESLYRTCGNYYLVEQILLIRKRVNPYRERSSDLAERILESWQEHDQILKAIIGKDETTAQCVATQHIVRGGRDMSKLASASPENLVFDTDTGGLPRVIIDMPRAPLAEWGSIKSDNKSDQLKD